MGWPLMPAKLDRVAKPLWLVIMAAMAALWATTVDFQIAGMDARYYFTAARQIMASQNPYSSGDYLYPSLAIWVMGPAIAHLPQATLTIIFNITIALSVLALATGSLVLTGLHPWSKSAPGAFGIYWWLPAAAVATLLFSGVTETVVGLGNISPMIGALCVWAGILYRNKRFKSAAVLVALASILKIIPALLLILMFAGGLRKRDRRLVIAAVAGGVLVIAGILLPPFALEFINGAGGTTKWGMDIGGACISIHIWLARALDDKFINHPDIALIVFSTAAAITALYGYFSRPGPEIRWLTVMMLANIASPKNCPHLFLAMTFPMFVMFARYLADGASVIPDISRRILRLVMAVALPVIASTSEFFYFPGHPFGTLVLPIIPILIVLFEALELNGRKAWLNGPDR